MNQGFEYLAVIPADAAGRTLLQHLALRYPHSTIEVWRQRIAEGQVRLDGFAASPDDRLRPGQSLVWRRPPWQEPDVPLAFAVLHRDDSVLAAAKPRGLPTVPNGGFLMHTLLHIVRRHAPAATPVHRLGRGTSGLVLFALTGAARSRLARDFREGRVEKSYRALVAGAPRQAAFTIDVPIGRVPHPRLGHVHAAAPEGRPATTHVRVLSRRGEGSLVEVHIPTGRPHQIRIHLAAAGHPLLGDPLYGVGGVPLPDPALPGEPGYWLHAHRLRFTHPGTGTPTTVECLPAAAPARAVAPAPPHDTAGSAARRLRTRTAVWYAKRASADQMKAKAPACARRKGSP
ncbi:MAG TPA: RluA family pseudouridine synthase [Vicinamibacteria bacterium]|nr:RluA family pseudouridine synthase [Vicinamibacteria bacterium]